MNIDPNWPRWIFASVSRHFTDALAAVNMPLFIEGQHRDTKDLPRFAEFRFYGPRWIQVSKGCWYGRIEINILIQFAMNDKDFHEPHQMVGDVAAAFKDALIAYKKGNRPQDDQSVLGCLKLLQNSATRDYLEINHFGQIDKQTKVIQATVEGHYQIELTTL